MSMILRTDELLEALGTDSPEGAAFEAELVSLTQRIADTLAARLGIAAGVASFEGTAFCGTACAMLPAYEGQPMPEVLGEYDSPSEWEG